MKKHILSFMFAFGVLLNITIGQVNQQWVFDYNVEQGENFAAVRMLVDVKNNVYLFGTVDSIDKPKDFCIVKISKNGTLLWKRDFPEINYVSYKNVILNEKGDIIVPSRNETEILTIVSFISSNGELLWDRTLNEGVRNELLCYNQNVLFVLGGTNYGYGAAYLLNNRGDIINKETYSTFPYCQDNQELVVKQKNGFLYQGKSFPFLGDTLHTWRFNNDGKVIKKKQYQLPNNFLINDVNGNNRNLVLSGCKVDMNEDTAELSTLKFDIDKNTTHWQSNYSFLDTDEVIKTQVMKNGDVISLNTHKNNKWSEYYYKMSITKYDQDGNLQFIKMLKDSCDAIGSNSYKLAVSDSGYVFIVYSKTVKSYFGFTFLVLDKEGNEMYRDVLMGELSYFADVTSTIQGDVYWTYYDKKKLPVIVKYQDEIKQSIEEEQVEISQSFLYPNPTEGRFIVNSPNQGVFSISDIRGRQINTGKLNEQFSLENHPNGIYFINVQNRVYKLIKN